MKKKYVFLLVGSVMFIFMLGFIVFSFNHPTSSWGIPFNIVSIIYWSYLITMLTMFIISFILFNKEKDKYRFLSLTASSIVLMLCMRWWAISNIVNYLETNQEQSSTTGIVWIYTIIRAALLIVSVVSLVLFFVSFFRNKKNI